MRLIFSFLLCYILGYNIAVAQTVSQTAEYITVKFDLYQHKNNHGDLIAYAFFLHDLDEGIQRISILEYAALSGDNYKKDLYTIDIKDIIAIERSKDEIGRPQIIIYSNTKGFTVKDYNWDEIRQENVLKMTFSSNISDEQLNSLIKSLKHLTKILGGRDLSKEKF